MVDLTTFGDNVDNTRFEASMQSTGINGTRSLYLSNKGIPKIVVDEVSNAADLINEGTNIEGSLFNIRDSISNSVAFIGEWKSNSSQVLVYFEKDTGV